MDKIILRPAQAADAAAIRNLVRASHINPTGLKWPRFLIAESQTGEFLACGQLKPHSDGSLEMASIAVREKSRHQGLARAIIEALMRKAPRPLHVMCRAQLGALYEKFGFYALQPEEMPPYFRRLARVVGLADMLAREGTHLLVMRCD